MDAFHESEERRKDSGLPSQLSSIVEQFENAWRDVPEDAQPPQLDAFVNQVAPEHRARLRELLNPIDETYRRQREPGGSTPETNTGAIEPTVLSPASVESSHGNEASFDVDSDVNLSSEPQFEATFLPDGEVADSAHDPSRQAGDGSSDPRTAATAQWQPGGEGHDQPGRREAEPRGPAPPSIPGYEIVATLGRGGMGVVYKARQTALNRLVALKMILGGGHAPPDQLVRFKAEAEAVAQLQHPNIVQIHDIGWQEGLPYFSLEFVEGTTLEEERGGRPMSASRAAELVETLSRAIHCAHQRGIVHRDLKPANVLMTREGVPKISDFGLVKRIEGESSQTKTGTIMGTPSYMAPEQAWGEKDVGPAADVYALGSMLYALLTGRPPFLGPTPLETVMQLRHQEAVPPTRLQPRIPRDLETICLKCLQKDPAKRYTTAEDLAEDLRRFQAREPILARPVGRAERIWRWCRRNPSLAVSGAVAAALALCLMIGGPAAAVMIYEQKEIAEQQKQLAEQNEAKALRAEALAKANEEKAIENAEIAGEQRDLAVETVNLVVEQLNDQLQDRPQMQGLRKDLLQMALRRLNRVADTASGSQNKNLVMARGHRKFGDLMLELGQAEMALDQYQRCHDIVLAMTAEGDPEKPYVPKLNLGRSYVNLGKAAERLKNLPAAQDYYLKSLEVRQAALPLAPDELAVQLLCKRELADAHEHLGVVLLEMGQPEGAQRHYQKVVELRGEWFEHATKNNAAREALAGGYLGLGHASLDTGQVEQAVEHYRKYLELLQLVADDEQNTVSSRVNLALAYVFLGRASLFSGDADQARGEFSQAVDLLGAMVQQSPRDARLKQKLADALYGLGVACRRLDDPQSGTHFQRCLQLRRALAEQQSGDLRFQSGLMLALIRCGDVEEAVRHAEALLKRAPDDPGFLYHVACCYAQCADAVQNADPAESPSQENLPVDDYGRKAVQVLRQAVEHGYRGSTALQLDPDLQPIQDRTDFQQLLKDLKNL